MLIGGGTGCPICREGTEMTYHYLDTYLLIRRTPPVWGGGNRVCFAEEEEENCDLALVCVYQDYMQVYYDTALNFDASL